LTAVAIVSIEAPISAAAVKPMPIVTFNKTERDFLRRTGALREFLPAAETSKERAITRYPNRYSYRQGLLLQPDLQDQDGHRKQFEPAPCRHSTAYENERLW
jgi:hypothetical protein